MEKRRLWLIACTLIFSGAALGWMHQKPASSHTPDLAFASCESSANCPSVGMSYFPNMW